jgi:hypothetical protein
VKDLGLCSFTSSPEIVRKGENTEEKESRDSESMGQFMKGITRRHKEE